MLMPVMLPSQQMETVHVSFYCCITNNPQTWLGSSGSESLTRLSGWLGLQSSEGSVGETHFQAHSRMAVGRRSSFLTTQASPQAKCPDSWQLASSEWRAKRRREPRAEATASVAFSAVFCITHWPQYSVGGYSVYTRMWRLQGATWRLPPTTSQD